MAEVGLADCCAGNAMNTGLPCFSLQIKRATMTQKARLIKPRMTKTATPQPGRSSLSSPELLASGPGCSAVELGGGGGGEVHPRDVHAVPKQMLHTFVVEWPSVPR